MIERQGSSSYKIVKRYWFHMLNHSTQQCRNHHI